MILVTDGDFAAKLAVEQAAREIGGRCISRSAGNPTPLDGPEIVRLIKQARSDPVLVMFDDNGDRGYGRGEQAIEYVVRHPDIRVIGAIAVASNTQQVRGARVNASIDNRGRIVLRAVNKEGEEAPDGGDTIYGDTVDVLNRLEVPNVIGVGDIGKMEGRDTPRAGCPITRKAVEWILKRSEGHDDGCTRKKTD